MNPLSLIGDIETCCRYGKALIDFVQKWRDADEELAHRVTAVDLCWVKTKGLILTVKGLHPIPDDEIRRVLASSLSSLRVKLDCAVVQVQELQDPGLAPRPRFLQRLRRSTKGAKYALYEGVLDAAIQDLEAWVGRCSAAVDLSMRNPSPVINERLSKVQETTQHGHDTKDGMPGSAKGRGATSRVASALSLTRGIRDVLHPTGPQPSVFLPDMALETSTIPLSRAKLACKRAASKKPQWFILDTLPCRAGTDVRALSGDVRSLALKLKRADPFAFGLLTCLGVMRVFSQAPQVELTGFDLVFKVPAAADTEQLQSLRALLLSPSGAPSLSRRVRLAQELATSVNYVHTFAFVHKNICPESVLLFKEEGGQTASSRRRSSFLIGFESFRSAAGGTSMMGDQDWAHNIYRHPERMGEFPAEEYKMQHDIYSLGVCLLEIGLWEPLVEYPEDGGQTPDYGRVCRDFAGTGRPWVFFKEFLVGLAETELPARMGDRYAEVVVTCLTCLDRDGYFGDQGDVADADGILVGVRFIETIFGQLNEIVV